MLLLFLLLFPFQHQRQAVFELWRLRSNPTYLVYVYPLCTRIPAGPAVPQKKPNKPPPSLKPKTVPKPAAHAAPQGKQDDAHTVKQGLPKSPSSVPGLSTLLVECNILYLMLAFSSNGFIYPGFVSRIKGLFCMFFDGQKETVVFIFAEQSKRLYIFSYLILGSRQFVFSLLSMLMYSHAVVSWDLAPAKYVVFSVHGEFSHLSLFS